MQRRICRSGSATLRDMKRKRLTREQSKDQTRERLIDSARTMFIKKGYVATSVEDIASAAGYTRGAFYSNFDGKAELLIELLRRDHDRMDADFQAIMQDGGTKAEIETRVTTYYSQMIRDDRCFPLWVEAKLLAGRDAKFRTRFNGRVTGRGIHHGTDANQSERTEFLAGLADDVDRFGRRHGNFNGDHASGDERLGQGQHLLRLLCAHNRNDAGIGQQ